MKDYLDVVTPYLHSELVSPQALNKIQALAQILPPFSFAAFECRLGANQSRVDFHVNLPQHPLNLPARFLTYSVWQEFQKFYQNWTESNSLLHRSVDSLILEFDITGQPSLVPIPCVLLTLNPEAAREDFNLMDITANWSFMQLNDSIVPEIKSNLSLCTNSLPDGARISNLAVMLSRPTQAVRVVVKGIPPHQLTDYLVQIGWSEPKNQISPIISTLSEWVDSMALAFDVGDTIHPRIGLECRLQKQPLDEPRWQLLLDYLVEKGLCTSAKRNALLAWPGFSQKAEQMQLWPSNLIWGDLFLGTKALSVFSRTIYEVKIVYQPNSPLSAKGYLTFSHDWFRTSD